MKKTISFGAAVLLAAVAVSEASGQAVPPAAAAGGTAASPPPAPAPGSPAIFRANADLEAALARSIANGGALSSASVVLTDEYRASLIRRTEAHGPITHAGNTEMHYIVDGRGTVETGGTIIRRDGQPATIEGGESHPVVRGDIVIIPAGSPHRYSEVIEPIVYLEFRFVAPN